MRRIQAEVSSVESRKKGGWTVSLRSCSTDRILYMVTTRAGYCKGQVVKLTCERVTQDGEILNARFGSWVPFLFSRKGFSEKQVKALTSHLKKFQQGCGLRKSKGRIQIEGGIEVSVDRRGWFLVFQSGTKDRIRSVCHARNLAQWLVKGEG